MASKATEEMVRLINSLCGCDAVSVGEDNIYVDDMSDDGGYLIECEDDDEVYNTLMLMHDGMMLLNSVRGKDAWLKVLEQRVTEQRVKVKRCEEKLNRTVAEFREWISTAQDIDIVYDSDWKARIVKDAHEKYKAVWLEFKKAEAELEEYKQVVYGEE